MYYVIPLTGLARTSMQLYKGSSELVYLNIVYNVPILQTEDIKAYSCVYSVGELLVNRNHFSLYSNQNSQV